jgi:hypothetical protein
VRKKIFKKNKLHFPCKFKDYAHSCPNERKRALVMAQLVLLKKLAI